MTSFKMVSVSFYFLTLVTFLSISTVNIYGTSTLKLVHVVFRHGNKTVFNSTTYPTDPYANETYQPFGYGELTEKGKLKAYNVGLSLRERYNGFLGNEFTHEELSAFSSKTNRTKISLELLLIGLYQSKNISVDWKNHSDWQPIPYSIALESEHILGLSFLDCPRYIQLYDEFLNSSIGKSIQEAYSSLFEYLSLKTGLSITENRQIIILHAILASQEDWGFRLPSWTKTVWPETINRAVGMEYLAITYTNEMKQLSGGFLLKKIIEDTEAKLNNNLNSHNKKKIFIYSGHDSNLGYLLGALKVVILHNPPYSAYVIIEIHTIENVDGVKIFYQDYRGNSLKQLVVPGCASFCPFTKFVQLLRNSIPENINACGIDSELKKID